MPWAFVKLVKNILNEKPKGLFLTGDISNGLFTCLHLKILATFVECPIYFVIGNHDRHFSSFAGKDEAIRSMCRKYPNLIWLTETDTIKLNDDVALIGVDGWYDARIGDPKYLRLSIDWRLIEDFRKLPTMSERIDAFRVYADEQTALLEAKLEAALSHGYRSIYALVHVPCWEEATRYRDSIVERYFLPYNTNTGMGEMLERVMAKYPRQNLTVLTGHVHKREFIRVSRNINCQVGDANQLLTPFSQIVYL